MGLVRTISILLLFNIPIFAKVNLLFYCDITMVNPMLEIVQVIEQKHDCKITIIQGGSRDLYASLDMAKKGDLFFPGDPLLFKNDTQGYFTYPKRIGYNTLAIFVQKGNPLHVKNLDDFLREDLLVAVGHPETSSIGVVGEDILLQYAGASFLKKLQFNLSMYAVDSRDMNCMLKDKMIDIGLNWKATMRSGKIKERVDMIEIDGQYSSPKALIMSVLKFSEHSDIARAFVDEVASERGQTIMRKYGF